MSWITIIVAKSIVPVVSLVLQFQSGSIWNVQIAEGLLKLVVKECLYTSIINF